MLKRSFFNAHLFGIFFCLLFFSGIALKKRVSILPEILIITGEVGFSQTIGGSKNEVLKSVIKTADGGYAVLGYTQSNDGDITSKIAENFDFWLLKFDANNTLSWQQTFGGSKDDRGADLIKTSDGGFALLGFSKSSDNDLTSNAGFQDFWILKLSPSGEISWQQTFGFSGSDVGTTLLETEEGGFLITGVLDVSASNGQGNAKTTVVNKNMQVEIFGY